MWIPAPLLRACCEPVASLLRACCELVASAAWQPSVATQRGSPAWQSSAATQRGNPPVCPRFLEGGLEGRVDEARPLLAPIYGWSTGKSQDAASLLGGGMASGGLEAAARPWLGFFTNNLHYVELAHQALAQMQPHTDKGHALPAPR
jgi:hypothetical protein